MMMCAPERRNVGYLLRERTKCRVEQPNLNRGQRIKQKLIMKSIQIDTTRHVIMCYILARIHSTFAIIYIKI